MTIAHDAESYVQEFAAEFDRWQARLENLTHMIPPVSSPARSRMEAGVLRIEAILRAASELLDRCRTISPEEWMEIHPRITAALRAAQYSYNDLVADWPQL